MSNSKLLADTMVPHQYDVLLILREGGVYVVKYGAQERIFTSLPAALVEHGHCVRHAMQCNGDFDDEQ